MALSYYPSIGEIVLCDYRGFIEPEMIKTRSVVVVSPRLRRRGNLIGVVPYKYHCPQARRSLSLPNPIGQSSSSAFRQPDHVGKMRHVQRCCYAAAG
ncbi:MAG: hypothetical protein HEQ18_08510 [Sphingorhabdus sp.]